MSSSFSALFVSEALALAPPLHNHAALIAARAQAAPDADTRSAGLPVGAQRARLFERWAQQLDAALADGNPDGPAQLRALQAQLQSRQRGLSEAPLTHGTPTLQAMPAGFVPAESNTAAAAAARQRRVP